MINLVIIGFVIFTFVQADTAKIYGDSRADIAAVYGENREDIAAVYGESREDIAAVYGESRVDTAAVYGERRADEGSEWGYGDDENGPSNWYKKYPDCNGKQQSPIKFVQFNETDIKPFTFGGYDTERNNMVLINNGHTVQLELAEGTEDLPYIQGGGLGARYYFRQLHFHWGLDNTNGPEHQIQGRQGMIMEMHLVHTNPEEAKNGNAGIAVLGVLFRQLLFFENRRYRPLTDALSQVKYNGQRTTLSESVTLNDFLPNFYQTASFYRYNGSLTTPPCTEGVIWTVYDTPSVIGANQIRQFRETLGSEQGQAERKMAPNFRPIQALNDRTVYRKRN